MSSELLQIDGLSPLKNGAPKTSKVMLLFPPEWVPTAPYLALPSLTAVLREAGHHVIKLVQMKGPPFSDGWEQWKPHPSWRIPVL